MIILCRRRRRRFRIIPTVIHCTRFGNNWQKQWKRGITRLWWRAKRRCCLIISIEEIDEIEVEIVPVSISNRSRIIVIDSKLQQIKDSQNLKFRWYVFSGDSSIHNNLHNFDRSLGITSPANDLAFRIINNSRTENVRWYTHDTCNSYVTANWTIEDVELSKFQQLPSIVVRSMKNLCKILSCSTTSNIRLKVHTAHFICITAKNSETISLRFAYFFFFFFHLEFIFTLVVSVTFVACNSM